MAQGKLSSGWDGTNNGYSFPIDIDITDSLFSLVLPTFFLLLFSLVLIGFVVKKVHSGITTIEQRYYTLAVFYSVGIVTLGLNIIELCFSIYVFKNLTTVSGSSSEGLFIVALKGILPKCVIFLFLNCDQHLSNTPFSFCLSHRSHFFAVFHWYTAVLYHISLCLLAFIRYDQGTSEGFITNSITS